ncbi:4Fe-4S binding protein [Desulfurivibrio alkaliphilus]|uniref:4Fe-4S ferredoxin iron-sulfur binding domain protein n=1 Tax=Desulfurivibrio alkaliphilus (strain DSM 19089 / UNIQEM U267 / AHT2) TaxID=589865 RepID=D6Z703_DESAT|nr:4Fe-4S binding protein [Desulfurivibrio alkaliphilus]ADH86990.1 4Fe-4S ferredoxin iron-sulfur binding domain protein [Desulfurivibrio alkaliphilus AHT 2]
MERIRRWVQVLSTLLVNGYWEFPVTRTIYQGPLKVLCAPGLNCYSCPAATTSCPIGALQQLFAGVRHTLESGQLYIGLYVAGFMGVMGGVLGRAVCGWLCPFGLIQDLLYKIPSRKFGIPYFMRYLKYGFLLFFVILLPLLVVNQFGSGDTWFCKYICPAGTLTAGIPMLIMQPSLRQAAGLLFLNKLFIMVMFIIWAVYASRPFCRTTCPLGAFYALFAKVRLVRLQLDRSRCTNCKACHQVCPMGVKFNESPDDAECITCLACMDKACEFDAISLEIGGVTVGSRSPRPAAADARKP